MPPFQRKTLILIGAQGVGRRSLKNRLIVMNPLRYGTTVPCESARLTAEQVTMSQLEGYLQHAVSASFLQSRHAVPEKKKEMDRTTVL